MGVMLATTPPQRPFEPLALGELAEQQKTKFLSNREKDRKEREKREVAQKRGRRFS